MLLRPLIALLLMVFVLGMALPALCQANSDPSLDRYGGLKRVMGTEEIHNFMVSRRETLPQSEAVGLVGADGTLINGSRQWPTPVVDLSDRDYFTYFRDHNDAGIFIGAPRPDRRTGVWTFFLGRRISGPKGEFLGVLLALMEIRYFEEFYQAINPPGGSVALFRDDGGVLAVKHDVVLRQRRLRAVVCHRVATGLLRGLDHEADGARQRQAARTGNRPDRARGSSRAPARSACPVEADETRAGRRPARDR